ncbi:MAG: hypothetical protein ACRDA3_07955 [Peptostreptococcaceae bacterium]
MRYKERSYNVVFPKSAKYFNEIDINHSINILSSQKIINKIISIKNNIGIGDIEIIKTPIMISNNNEKFTGCKIAVELKIDELITYMSGGEESTLEVIRNSIVKNVFITIPIEYNKNNVIDLLRNRKIKITPYLEDIYAVRINDREINVNMAIFINVEFLII